MANDNGGGTPASSGPVSQGMSGTPATAGPVSQGMAGTPATAGPVSTIGGAVATGQGNSPGGNAGSGASMLTPEGQTAKAPNTVKIGPDGEPEPAGTPTQFLVGALVASSFDKKSKERLGKLKESLKDSVKKQQEDKKKMEKVDTHKPAPKGGEELQAKQDEAHKAYREITNPGQTQSTPGPTPVQQNDVNLKNVKIEGKGTVQPPKEENK